MSRNPARTSGESSGLSVRRRGDQFAAPTSTAVEVFDLADVVPDGMIAGIYAIEVAHVGEAQRCRWTDGSDTDPITVIFAFVISAQPQFIVLRKILQRSQRRSTSFGRDLKARH